MNDVDIEYVTDEPVPTDYSPKEVVQFTTVAGDNQISALAAAMASGAPLVERVMPPMPPRIDEPLEYEVVGEDGSKQTFDTSGPNANVGVLDPMTAARHKLKQLKLMRKLLKMQKRQIKLREGKDKRKNKSRKKSSVAKASRKRNR